MKTKSTLKTLTLTGALALGLVLAPVISQAAGGDRDRGDRGDRSQQQHAQADGKYRGNDHSRRDYDKRRDRGHSYDRHESSKAKKYKHKRGHAYGHYKPVKYRRGHQHEVQYVTNYVVPEYGYRDRYVELSDLRFMIGLHTNNLDLIYRD